MYEYKVKTIKRVIDGDTVEVELDLGFHLTLCDKVRLAGINTPETRTKDLEEKGKGLKAKEWMQNKMNNIGDKTLIVKYVKEEKFGRLLGWLYIDGEPNTINEQLINEGLAEPFMVDKLNPSYSEPTQESNPAP